MDSGDHTSGLSAAKLQLVRLMQEVWFGTIALFVRSGEPVMDPPPQITLETKFNRKREPRSFPTDFALKTEVADCLDAIRQIEEGIIYLEIQHGLPFRMRRTRPAW